nr:hypothetical protein CFP56_64141 [Quercus suber]
MSSKRRAETQLRGWRDYGPQSPTLNDPVVLIMSLRCSSPRVSMFLVADWLLVYMVNPTVTGIGRTTCSHATGIGLGRSGMNLQVLENIDRTIVAKGRSRGRADRSLSSSQAGLEYERFHREASAILQYCGDDCDKFKRKVTSRHNNMTGHSVHGEQNDLHGRPPSPELTLHLHHSTALALSSGQSVCRHHFLHGDWIM